MNETILGLERCPGCGSKNLIPVNAGEQTNYFCDICVLCWQLEGRMAKIVDPQTCPGCQLGKTACLGGTSLHARW